MNATLQSKQLMGPDVTPQDCSYPQFLSAIAELILTPAKLKDAIALHQEYQAANQTNCSTAAQRRNSLRAMLQWAEAQGWARDSFTGAISWTRWKRITPMQLAQCRKSTRRADDEWWLRGRPSTLVWDHPEFFAADRVPAGIIVHVYADSHEDCAAFAARSGLRYLPLPWSWYYPAGCLAGVYLPGAADG